MTNLVQGSRTLPLGQQLAALAGLTALVGAAMALIFLFSIKPGSSQESPERLARLVPTHQQMAGLQFLTVKDRVFYTEIVTDGYVASNGGFAAAGLPSGKHLAREIPLLTGQSADVIQAGSDLVTAAAQFQAAKTNEQRQQALYKADGAALKDWQQSQADFAVAASALASARNRLRILGKTDGDIAALEKQGGPASASQVIFSVGDATTVWLVANVREEDAGLVRKGNTLQARLTAFPDEVFEAPVSYVAPLIDNVTHRLVVAAAIRNPDGRIKPNMQATITILAGAPATHPAIPQNAVIHDGDHAEVWISNPDGGLAPRNVSIGRISGPDAEVTRGLSAGDQVVVRGALFLDQAAKED